MGDAGEPGEGPEDIVDDLNRIGSGLFGNCQLHRGDAIGDSARLMRDAFRRWGHAAEFRRAQVNSPSSGSMLHQASSFNSETSARRSMRGITIWKIVDGKLYLNCSQAAYEKWSRDIPGNIKKADENWLKLGR